MDELAINHDVIEGFVQRVLTIEDITYGDPKKDYVIRFHGKLKLDSAAAYDQLAGWLKPHNYTPLFRLENGRHTVLVIQGVQNPKASNPRINLIFFILTLLSVWFTGGILSVEGDLPTTFQGWLVTLLFEGWPFALSMLAILGAHEFGHYFAGRRHGVKVTLPYFLPLPFPFSPFGTFGAFINIKEVPKNRRVLLDIGIAGPLSGLVVAIPVLLIGLSLSELNHLPLGPAGGGIGQAQMEGNSILYLLLKFITFGRLLPAPLSMEGFSPILYWLQYLFTGTPLPYGALDVTLHPVAWAGWGGILITSLNLIPAGQLDGGHILSVLVGKERMKRIYPFVLAALIGLGFIWQGWWFWALLIFFFGRLYAEPLDQITQLDTRRKNLAILALIVFILVFTPVPLITLP